MKQNPSLRILSLVKAQQWPWQTGEFGVKPDAAVFADTGWEPKPVIQHLEYFRSYPKRFF